MLLIPTGCSLPPYFLEVSLPKPRYNWDYKNVDELITSLWCFLQRNELMSGRHRVCLLPKRATVRNPTTYEAIFLTLNRLLFKGYHFRGLRI
jgi:hypothetical protein